MYTIGNKYLTDGIDPVLDAYLGEEYLTLIMTLYFS